MMDQDEPDLPGAIEPKTVHMTWSPALRGMGVFGLVLLMCLIPVVLMTPGLIAAAWLSIAGNTTEGKVVAIRDNRDPVADPYRTRKYYAISTVQFDDNAGHHVFEWNGKMPAPALSRSRWPEIGDVVPVRVLEGIPSSARVDRFADIWLPHGLLWPMCFVFVLVGGAFSFGHYRARRRGLDLETRNQCIDVDCIEVEKDTSYTDGRHFRYVAQFKVDGRSFISRTPTSKQRLNPMSSGQILYLPEDPSVNRLEILDKMDCLS
jgi:hypothetical protein